jgi:hypothetical protein
MSPSDQSGIPYATLRKLSHKHDLWVAASAATLEEIKNWALAPDRLAKSQGLVFMRWLHFLLLVTTAFQAREMKAHETPDYHAPRAGLIESGRFGWAALPYAQAEPGHAQRA